MRERVQPVSTFNDVWRKMSANKEYRSAFAKAQFKRLVPFQIRALRKNRHMSQEKLAEQANLTQGVISRAEDSDYGNLTVNTILKVADGFDCAFVGRFVPFSELDDWFLNLSEDTVQVPSFDEENQLFRLGGLPPRRRVSRPKIRTTLRIIQFDTREAVTLRNPLPTAAGATQLSLWDFSVGSGAGSQLVNSPPRPQGSTSILNRSMKVAVGAGRNYGSN
jgi:transcriptional regulator with XRE-family HTH domain